MKKIIFIMCLLFLIVLSGCGKSSGDMYFGNRFQIKEKHNKAYVLVDKDTGVNYLYIKSGYARVITVMYDNEGKVLISK